MLSTKPTLKIPTVGSQWIFNRKATADPFETKPSSAITVLEIKQGWVRYKIGNGWLFHDERLSIEDFLDYYKPL